MLSAHIISLYVNTCVCLHANDTNVNARDETIVAFERCGKKIGDFQKIEGVKEWREEGKQTKQKFKIHISQRS